MSRRFMPTVAIGLALRNLLGFALSLRAEGPFAIKDGDRIVFYGDSITDQRLYTTFVETYIVTRFPSMNVSFVHSGWGGDRVTGGGGGRIDHRLDRDVFSYKPTVVTVMLGMNDASYRPFDQKTFDIYAKGYAHLVESLKSHIPGVRITLIQPSPFDDVTRKPNFEGGYNQVLNRYGEFVKELAEKEGAGVADLNTPVVAALKKAMEINATGAQELIKDRVHPGPAGQLLMAEALLKAWNAPGRRHIGRARRRLRQGHPRREHQDRRTQGQRHDLLDPARSGIADAHRQEKRGDRAGGEGLGRRGGTQPANPQGLGSERARVRARD